MPPKRLGFLREAQVRRQRKKDDDPVFIVCRKQKAGILGSGLEHLGLVAGACNAPKTTVLSLPFSFALTREVAA